MTYNSFFCNPQSARAKEETISRQPTSTPPPRGWGLLAIIGPGIAIAATGVGAGDMVAATVTGARFGLLVVWSALAGALFKYVTNEGIARWQLATGTTLVEGWTERLGRPAQYYFLVYLVIWSFFVAGGLMAACGMVGYAFFPRWPVSVWGMVHSIAALILALRGRYTFFERLMKAFIGLMFVAILWSALVIWPGTTVVLQALFVPSLPAGAGKYLLGVIGGVGGTVTLLSYGYWIKEKNWQGLPWLGAVRLDLAVAYLLTGLFGIAIMVLAGQVLHTQKIEVSGQQGVLQMANLLGETVGPAGHWIFLVGFWGAVFSSVLGVWQGIPYLFADYMALLKGVSAAERERYIQPTSPYYRAFLLFLAFPPMVLLQFGRPVWLVVFYAVVGAFFMPFLVGTLLYMNNNRAWVGEQRNRWIANTALLLALLLFVCLCWSEIAARITVLF